MRPNRQRCSDVKAVFANPDWCDRCGDIGVGGDRVGVRIGPSNKFGAMGDSTPDVTFPYVARALTHFGVAYLHVIEPRVVANMSDADKPPAGLLRPLFRGPMIADGSAFTKPVADRICVVVDVLGKQSV